MGTAFVMILVTILVSILVLVVLVIAGGIALLVQLFPYIAGTAILIMGWKIIKHVVDKDKNIQ